MNGVNPGSSRLELILAATLQYGTWLASVVIAAGLAAFHPRLPLISAGIALFILLPVLRVVLMTAFFLRNRDYRLGAISTLVLGIILFGFVLGVLSIPASGIKAARPSASPQIESTFRLHNFP